MGYETPGILLKNVFGKKPNRESMDFWAACIPGELKIVDMVVF